MPNWVDIPNNTEWQYDDSIQNRTETDPNTGEEVYNLEFYFKYTLIVDKVEFDKEE